MSKCPKVGNFSKVIFSVFGLKASWDFRDLMFTTVSQNGTWHCFKVCTFRYMLYSEVFQNILWQKFSVESGGDRESTNFRLKWPSQRKMILRLAVYQTGVRRLSQKISWWLLIRGKFEFSKWWNAHIPLLNLTHAIISRLNPFKSFPFLR